MERAAETVGNRARPTLMRRVGPVHAVPLAVLAALLCVTAAAAVFAANLVSNQESRLLRERVNEVNLVLANSLSSTEIQLSLLAQDTADQGVNGFDREAATEISAAGGGSPVDYLLVDVAGPAPVVTSALGPGAPAAGSALPPAAAAAVRAAAAGKQIAASAIYGSGAGRSFGIALKVSPTMVVYRETVIGPVRPPREAASAPFSELRVVIYAGARAVPSQILLATTTDVPLRGQVDYAPLLVGSTRWLTGVSAVQPLVGSVAAAAPWVTAGVGLALTLLAFLLLEAMATRRDEAVDALAQEHRFAEVLQRRLLPDLPRIEGLDVASRYVAGADFQQVGGDWFDVFPLSADRVAVVIGDVMGHDVEAAAIMAQLRASLRSFATEGGEPAWTVERLSHFIEQFDIPSIVTVVYGVLGPQDPAGNRHFVWANAGHLPPLLRRADGRVEELVDGSSPLLGAPAPGHRPAGERRLRPGDTLMLYTDGLVEVRGEDLGATVAALRQAFAASGDADANGICDSLLAAHPPRGRRDDVALLVVRVGPPIEPATTGRAPTSRSVKQL